MVDTKEFLRIILKFDEGGLILGGRYQPINDLFEYFFGEIKKCGANLVFFWRLGDGNTNRYMTNNEVFDFIKNHESLEEHLHDEKQQIRKNALRPCERYWYNLIQISKNYGDVFVSYGMDIGTILSYARQHCDDILALVTRNTDYLVFDDDFEFWSLSDVHIFEFKIMKFDRDIMVEKLGLNSLQMQLLHAISNLEPEAKREISGKYFCDLLHGCTPYVKRQKYDANGYDVLQLTGNLTEAQREQISNDLKRMNKLNSYTASLDDDICDIKDIKYKTKICVMQFYKHNLYFAYKLMNEMSTIQKDLTFIDLRQPNSAHFVHFVANTTLKLWGVLFKHIKLDMHPETRLVATATNGTIEPIKMNIIYPPSKQTIDLEFYAKILTF